MAYERQYYTNGDVLDARQMNHMETGIKENSDNIDKLSKEIENFAKNAMVPIHGNYALGSLKSGVLDPITYRVSLVEIVSFEHELAVYIKDGFRAGFHLFNDGVFYKDTGWKTGSFVIGANQQFKMVIARTVDFENRSEIITDISEFVSAIRYKQPDINNHAIAIEKNINNIDKILMSEYNLRSALEWQVGGMYDDGTIYPHHDCRIYAPIISFPFDVDVISYEYTKNGEAKASSYKIVTFSDSNYSEPTILHNYIASYRKVTIPKNTYFSICVLVRNNTQSVDDTTPIDNIATSEQFLNICIRNAETTIYNESQLNSKVCNACMTSVSHQGFSTTGQYYGNSRISSYIASYQKGYEMVETDVQWSKDNVPVCCHDATFIDTTDNTTVITIANYDAETLKLFGYYGESIATLEEVIKLCKILGMKLEIDKISSNWSDEQWQVVFDLVSKYQMQKYIVWTCPDYLCSGKILAYDKWAVLMINFSGSNLDEVINVARGYATDYNEIIIACNYSSLTIETLAEYNMSIPERNISIGVWTIDDIEEYKKWLPYSSFITSNKLQAHDVMKLYN